MAKKDNFKKVFTKYAEEYLDTRIQNVFQKVALSIFDKLMREDVLFQNQTGTLTASTGIGIFKNGRMVQWVDNPNYPASQQTVTYKGQKTVVNGQKLLNATLAATDARTAGKYVMVLVSSAPYAYSVEAGLGTQRADGMPKRGIGWWSEDIVPYLTQQFLLNAKLMS